MVYPDQVGRTLWSAGNAGWGQWVYDGNNYVVRDGRLPAGFSNLCTGTPGDFFPITFIEAPPSIYGTGRTLTPGFTYVSDPSLEYDGYLWRRRIDPASSSFNMWNRTWDSTTGNERLFCRIEHRASGYNSSGARTQLDTCWIWLEDPATGQILNGTQTLGDVDNVWTEPLDPDVTNPGNTHSVSAPFGSGVCCATLSYDITVPVDNSIVQLLRSFVAAQWDITGWSASPIDMCVAFFEDTVSVGENRDVVAISRGSFERLTEFDYPTDLVPIVSDESCPIVNDIVNAGDPNFSIAARPADSGSYADNTGTASNIRTGLNHVNLADNVLPLVLNDPAAGGTLNTEPTSLTLELPSFPDDKLLGVKMTWQPSSVDTSRVRPRRGPFGEIAITDVSGVAYPCMEFYNTSHPYPVDVHRDQPFQEHTNDALEPGVLRRDHVDRDSTSFPNVSDPVGRVHGLRWEEKVASGLPPITWEGGIQPHVNTLGNNTVDDPIFITFMGVNAQTWTLTEFEYSICLPEEVEELVRIIRQYPRRDDLGAWSGLRKFFPQLDSFQGSLRRGTVGKSGYW